VRAAGGSQHLCICILSDGSLGPSDSRGICILFAILRLPESSFVVAEFQFCGCWSPVLQPLEVNGVLDVRNLSAPAWVLVALRQLWRGGVQTVVAICHCATTRPRAQSERTRESAVSRRAIHQGGGETCADFTCPLPILHLAQDASLAASDPFVVCV